MCGIVGLIHEDAARPVPPSLITRMCAAIRHRGPDDEGTHVRGPVGLGMRRLAIIDVEGGKQPIFNESGESVIVFNGEIYNYRPLQQALRAHGHTFQTQSDTETILHLYEEEGPACVQALRGMFAFAIWDARARSLFLARDRFGIKPLYYVLAPWGIAFASELKALLAAGLSARQLDWEGLDAYFELGYLPAPHTPFTDVKKLPPGHTLTWRPGGTPLIQRYWDLPTAGGDVPPRGEAQVLADLDDSVAAHLVSDVPIAAFLSGGLDSSAVVASAAQAGAPPHAFTARYLGSGAAAADETALARELATRWGVPLTVVDVAPAVAQVLEPITWAMDEPHADDSVLPTWLMAQAVGAEYKVALTGIGGDELFGGYRRHLGLLWSEWYTRVPAPLRRALAAGAMHLREPADGGLGIDRLKRFTRIGPGDGATRFQAMVGRLGWEERSALYRPGLGRRISGLAATSIFAQHYRAAGGPRGIAGATYLDFKTFLPDDILALSDRLSMAHGLEVRVPFVDHRLVEAIYPLSDWTKVPWGRPKGLLRRALRSRLPAAHFRAPKRGFVGPTASWLRHELRPMLQDELSSARLSRLGMFDTQMVGRMLKEHQQGIRNREGILWALLCFSLWHRLYCETPPANQRIDSAMKGAGSRQRQISS